MGLNQTKRYLLYFSAVAVIGIWWSIAFWNSNTTPRRQSHHRAPVDRGQESATDLIASLSVIDRDVLREALAGDVRQIAQFISDWDLDAQLMRLEGINGIKRLDEQDLLMAQKLARQLQSNSTDQLEELRRAHRVDEIIDDTGHVIDLERINPKRFLPQSYASASVLLAIIEPNAIVALPRGMRDDTYLYPKSILDQIPMDADRYESERIFNSQPDLAFVAQYSQPATIETLRNQGIELFAYNKTNSIPNIIDGVVRMGHAVNRPLKAELMGLFIEAALTSIDNRVAVMKQRSRRWPERILFLNGFTHYATPTQQTLTAHLLQRLGMDQLVREREASERNGEWSIPISMEEMASLSPDGLIVSAPSETRMAMVDRILTEPALADLPAIQRNRVFGVDGTIQSSPSQYVVLAYYDLFLALQATIAP